MYTYHSRRHYIVVVITELERLLINKHLLMSIRILSITQDKMVQ